MDQQIKSPQIDMRKIDDIVDRLRALIYDKVSNSDNITWQSINNLKNDSQANAFIYIYSKMFQVILERLNRVPEKNYVAFLEMLGVQPEPPKAARVPITFDLTTGSKKRLIVVPEKTQVAAENTADGKPLIFETEEEFTIIRPDLEKAIVIDGIKDRWFAIPDHIFMVEESSPVTLFKGNELISHRLYIGDSQALSLDSPVQLVIKTEMDSTTIDQDLFYNGNISWYAFIDGLDEPLLLNVEKTCEKYNDLESSRSGIDKEIASFLKPGYIKFEDINNVIIEKELTGYEKLEQTAESSETGISGDLVQNTWTNMYIYAELDDPIGRLKHKNDEAGTENKYEFPVINNITFIAKSVNSETPGKVDLFFHNYLLIDASKTFYPFGMKPVFNDTFYIASEGVLSKKGATVIIKFNKPDSADEEDIDDYDKLNVKIRWEFFDGEEWQLLGISSNDSLSDAEDDKNDAYNFSDNFKAFTWKGSESSGDVGEISFTCPDIKSAKVGNEENLYIRARIISGSYEINYEENIVSDITGGDIKKIETTIIRSKWLAPVIDSVEISYESLPVNKTPDYILSYNNFVYKDCIEKNENEDQEEDKNSPKINRSIIPFRPFEHSEETSTTLYFCFNEDVADLPVNLFFSLVNSDDEALSLIAARDSISLILEYWNGEVWQSIYFDDDTDNLTKRESIYYYVPEDIKSKILFETESYWFRLRYRKGTSRYFPRIDGLYINTIWSKNAVTIENEILGSSNGLKDQKFAFSNTPVLPDQEIFVKENSLTMAEKEEIINDNGEGAIIEEYNSATGKMDIWVKWQEVSKFYCSDKKSRHYIIDRFNNEIVFGNGTDGRIPPISRNNIKAVKYWYGGGARGNVKKGELSKLRTSIPFVGSVFNIFSAFGGEDIETMDQITERGANEVKFQYRAVTPDDYESLVNIYSKKIAKIKTISNYDIKGNYKQGYITLLILSNSTDPKPLIELEVILEIQDFINEKSLSYLTKTDDKRINIITPMFIRVDAEAKVLVTDEAYDSGKLNLIEYNVSQRLKDFFHSITGGQKKNGWDFGENVPISEVVAEIEQTEGVEAVEYIILKPSMQQASLIPRLADPDEKITVTQAFPELSTVKVGSIQQYILADDLNEGEEVDHIIVRGFCEEDEIEIIHKDEIKTIYIDAIRVKDAESIVYEEDENLITVYYDEIDIINDDNEKIIYINKAIEKEILCSKILQVDYNKIRLENVDILETYPIGSLVWTIDRRVRSYLISELPKNIYASFDIETPFEIEIAACDKEKTYDFEDEFEDDNYTENWSEYFLPENLAEYEGFTPPCAFEKYPLLSKPEVLALEANLFLIVYSVKIFHQTITRAILGKKNEDNTIDYSEPKTIQLGSRPVRKSYYVNVRKRGVYWYKYSYKRRIRRWWHWRARYYYYTVRQKRFYNQYVPIVAGNLKLTRLPGKKFAVCFHDLRDLYKGHIIIGNYENVFDFGDIDNIIYGPRKSFAAHAVDFEICTVYDDKETVLYATRDHNLVSQEEYELNYLLRKWYKRQTIANREILSEELIKFKANNEDYTPENRDNFYNYVYFNNVLALLEDAEDAPEAVYGDIVIAFRGHLNKFNYHSYKYFKESLNNGNLCLGTIKPVGEDKKYFFEKTHDHSGTFSTKYPENLSFVQLNNTDLYLAYKENTGFGYINKITYDEIGSFTVDSAVKLTLDNPDSIADENAAELIFHELRLKNIDNEKLAIVYTKKDKNSASLTGEISMINTADISMNYTKVFANTNRIKELNITEETWNKRNSVNEITDIPCFIISFIDGNNSDKCTLVRCEIENENDFQFNESVKINDDKVENFDLNILRGINEDQYPVRFAVIYTKRKKLQGVLGSNLSLFGRATDEEERYINERNGVLSIDTGIAYENTPKRLYNVISNLFFEKQSFKITMIAAIGDFVEGNYSIFMGLYSNGDEVTASGNPDIYTSPGIQLRISSEVKDLDSKPDRPKREKNELLDLDVEDKITLIGKKENTGEYESITEELILPVGSLSPNLKLVLELSYELDSTDAEYGKLTGRITGINAGTEVFNEQIELDEIVFKQKSRIYMGTANLMCENPDDPDNDDVDVRSRSSVNIGSLKTNLIVYLFKEYLEDRFTILHNNDPEIEMKDISLDKDNKAYFEIKSYYDYKTGLGSSANTEKKADMVYLDKQNLVYPGIYKVEAVKND